MDSGSGRLCLEVMFVRYCNGIVLLFDLSRPEPMLATFWVHQKKFLATGRDVGFSRGRH